ncbi:hypothetical protein [Acinetobacter tianfuensis]|uniref:Uncharacterized protein n=1 Tax=Acinetobacter tianfuensis TaxID=2419603 RepID=A0A3A8EKF3_9GAMM|nr:hypothetical protein [Acinetobacter tianfuensis]RKG29371.1 hypothetical protein D7V32_15355 [Acinetobacter tianfuensis]
MLTKLAPAAHKIELWSGFSCIQDKAISTKKAKSMKIMILTAALLLSPVLAQVHAAPAVQHSTQKNSLAE